MKIAQSFRVERPVADVWAYLADVPAVATCLPGAEITADKGGGAYAGKVSVKLGPFSAAFEGEATVTRDEAARIGRVEGKGVDKRGGSRSRMVMDYTVEPDGTGSRISVDADVTLSGPIAQFGRIGLMQETANILIKDFAVGLEARLAAAPVAGTSMATPGDIAEGVVSTAADAAWSRSAGSLDSRSARPAGINMLSLLWRMLSAWLGRVVGR